MSAVNRRSLRLLTLGINRPTRFISDDRHRVRITDLQHGYGLPGIEMLHNRTVLINTETQLATVLALLALDGVARRILLATPDLAPHLADVIATAQVEAVLTDHLRAPPPRVPVISLAGLLAEPDRYPNHDIDRSIETQWILFTSGTTGTPKMAVHSLPSLTGPLDDGLAIAPGAVWSTFYDIRRYGGLQILLRALLGGGSMVLSSPQEPTSAFLSRLAEAEVSHISGTPSHWRKATMSPNAAAMQPRYVRLSGEIADQPILDRLARLYPMADVAHAFASTEAGVAFDVRDGRAGFPAAMIENPSAYPNVKADLRVIDGTLHIRSSRNASGYLDRPLNVTDDGFVDTGDLVIKDGDRYFFKGRREGVINVGGRKVYPEEVEAALCQHPAIRLARAYGRKSPITGALVVADVVLADPEQPFAAIRDDVIAHCQHRLQGWKTPAIIKPVASIALNAAGKVARHV
jgi:acyl-CoA synthetase (AMP-forming)/AMP-acid ligase II